jgi:hypothetical protein
MAKREKSSGTGEERHKQRRAELQKYVSDMIAVEQHIGAAFRKQVNDERLSSHDPRAGRIVNRLATISEQHEQALKSHLEELGGDTAKGIKEVATAAMGTLAGIYDKVRTEAVSKMLRDDYTAVSLAAISYTMLHTTGLSMNGESTADLALRHMEAYAPIIMELAEVIPSSVVVDLRDEGATISESIIQQAVGNTQSVWQRSSGEQDSRNRNGAMAGQKPPSTKRAAAGKAEGPTGKVSASAKKPAASDMVDTGTTRTKRSTAKPKNTTISA